MTNEEKYCDTMISLDLNDVCYYKNQFYIDGTIKILNLIEYECKNIPIITTIPPHLINVISPYQALCTEFKEWLRKEYKGD